MPRRGASPPDFRKARRAALVCTQRLGLRWDFTPGMPAVDLDASALLFDEVGFLVDAAYYNQLSAGGGSVTHSGDEKSGASEGDDESITIDGPRLPSNVRVIVVVLNAFRGGSLGDLETASARLCVEGGGVLADMSLGGAGSATAAVMCVLYRDHASGVWSVKDISKHGLGRTFMASMPIIRPVVDSLLDPVMVEERGQMDLGKTFSMSKGQDMALPGGVGEVQVGLGWSCRRSFDLDASCLMVKPGVEPSIHKVVYYGNQNAPGVRHSGDNTTGAGSGDDEVIKVSLGSVPREVGELVFTVNIYTSGGTFRDVHDAYVRLVCQGKELARYKLDEGVTTDGLMFAKLYRCGSQWRMLALGQGVEGRNATAEPVTKAALGLEDSPTTFQASQPSASASGGASAAQPPATTRPGEADVGGCCTIM